MADAKGIVTEVEERFKHILFIMEKLDSIISFVREDRRGIRP